MYRKFEEELKVWKQNKRKKPLLVKGPNHIGKTWTIRKFANEHYDHIIEINFELDHDYMDLFEKTIKPDEILAFIELANLDKDLSHGDTLLFLDEIQACPRAITALKFLYEKCPYDVIASGSMLGVAIAHTSSFPVGYVDTRELHPMDFEEFLLAMNAKSQHIQMLKDACHHRKPFMESIHQQFLKYFKDYMLCGGMPEVVQCYVETKNWKQVILTQRRIVSDYTNDMAKYAPANDKIKVHECFSSIPLQLAKDNKKFQYKVVKEGYNARYYDASLRWLSDSGLIMPVHCLKCIDFPLEAYEQLSIFKVYMFDTGLLISLFNEAVIAKIHTGDLGIFKGAIYENMAAQIMYANHKAMYYFEPNTSSEIDFVTYCGTEITPIEIKSGVNTRSKSFDNFVIQYHSKIAYRFSEKNIGESDGVIRYLPIYLLPFIF